jgi:hypothetical protein
VSCGAGKCLISTPFSRVFAQAFQEALILARGDEEAILNNLEFIPNFIDSQLSQTSYQDQVSFDY